MTSTTKVFFVNTPTVLIKNVNNLLLEQGALHIRYVDDNGTKRSRTYAPGFWLSVEDEEDTND